MYVWYVCMVRMYVCMYVCMNVRMYVWYVCMYVGHVLRGRQVPLRGKVRADVAGAYPLCPHTPPTQGR